MDWMSSMYAQSSAGRAAAAHRSRDNEEYEAYLEIVRQAAAKIELDEAEITPEAMNSSYLSESRVALNLREAAPKMFYTIYGYGGTRPGTGTDFEIPQKALKLRLLNYFMKDVKDYTKENKLECAIAFVKGGHMKADQFVNECLSLKTEEAAEVVQEFPDVNFNNLITLMRFPSLFSAEATEKIIKTDWLSEIKTRANEGWGLKSFMGLNDSKDDREFRSHLQNIYEQNTGGKFEDLQLDGKGFFDYVYKASSFDYQNNLLMTDYKEQFFEKVVEEQTFNKVLPYLELQENGELADTDTTRELSAFLDENWKIVESNNHINSKLHAYLYHRMQVGILDEKAAKLIFYSSSKTEENHPLFTEALYNGAIKDVQMEQKVLEAFWLRSAKIDSDYIKKRYSELTGKNIKALVDDEGQGRFQWLVENMRNIGDDTMFSNVMKDFPDEFLNLPLEKIKNIDFNYVKELDLNDELEPQNLEKIEFMSCVIEKFGSQILASSWSGKIDKNKTDVLVYRYKKGIAKPEEKEALRKVSNSHINELERLANLRGESFYQIDDLSYLIKENKEKSLEALFKNGISFENDSQKYKVFYELIENAFANDKKKEFFSYIERMMKDGNLELAKINKFLDKESDFKSSVYLDFALHYYGKNPAVNKSVLEFAAREAQERNSLNSERIAELKKSGFNIKAQTALRLIHYRKNRNAEFDIPENPQDYDFNVLAENAPIYHSSNGSKTTFLNEACIYHKGEAAAMALNQGADPFLKNEFAMGKKSGLPFAGMFRREMKNGLDDVKKFMTEIAAHLDEGKGAVLENIWRSLGRDLRETPQVKAVIDATNRAYKNRDFKAEKKAVIEARRAAEERKRLEQIEREEYKRKEDEQRAREKREKDLGDLKDNVIRSFKEELPGLNDVKVAEKIAAYLHDHKEELPVIPNQEELEKINEKVKEYRNYEREKRAENNEHEIKEMNNEISSFIFGNSNYGEKIADPEQVKQFIHEKFAGSKFAEGFAEGETAYIERRQLEAAKKIKLLKQFEEVAEKEMDKFFNTEAGEHGDSYFMNVGRERRKCGMEMITDQALEKMGILDEIKEHDETCLSHRQDYPLYYKCVRELVERHNEEKKASWLKKSSNKQEASQEEASMTSEVEAVDGGASSREEIKAAKAKAKQAEKGEQANVDLSALAGMWGAKIKNSKR